MYSFFVEARKLLEGPLWYDTGFADDYLSWADRQEVLKRFDKVIAKSLIAWHKTYDTNNDHKGAIELWQQIFGKEFPNYG
ncbi:hypothetical protein D3C76_1821840 [compost metagenome]